MRDTYGRLKTNYLRMKEDKYIWDEFKKGEEYALSHIYNQNIDFLFFYGEP